MGLDLRRQVHTLHVASVPRSHRVYPLPKSVLAQLSERQFRASRLQM
jgi:hypothetical protein